jgi:hypothetical protein
MKPIIARDYINLKGQDYLIIDKNVKYVERAETIARLLPE